jgi:hypothetical protein
MDLSQTKLTRAEWETIEVPVPEREKKILSLIVAGYRDLNIKSNDATSLFSFTKIDRTPEIEWFLYTKYFQPTIQKLIQKYKIGTESSNGAFVEPTKPLKTADAIRIQNTDATIKQNSANIFEFILLDLAKQCIKFLYKEDESYAMYLYTLIQLKKSTIPHQNAHLAWFIQSVIEYANERTEPSEIISKAYDFIERNPYLLQYEDRVLFPHQKELFYLCRASAATPKLILYTAPTGTGKTLSPLGLAEGHRIIFVCVARHIGLALAKAAITMEKKVAVAFGCETSSDIRLH